MNELTNRREATVWSPLLVIPRAYARRLASESLRLPLSTQHTQVALITPLSVFLSGGEEFLAARARLFRPPLSGTVLLQKRNMKRNRRTEIASGGRYEE